MKSSIEEILQRYDIVIAAASLHHLRETEEWELVFSNIFDAFGAIK